ncbi:MAG: adenylate/guanylate cyclase domain-containing protein, partial [Stellaceae bacterium]
EYTVIGDTVNLAAKLEKQNKLEGTRALSTAESLERALVQGYHPLQRLERRPQRLVGGLPEPIDLVVLS